MSEIAVVLQCLFLSSERELHVFCTVWEYSGCFTVFISSERGSFMFSAQFVLTNLGVSLCSLVFFFVGAFFPV